ncbi:DNA cytosine methyltransferase [Streptomyces sp. NPDC059720]|uniref:DNA cytosine methyltransferase n=1 Tax=Streptomyces sp. NPDC059720 TaxID=3346924 RepID=UPI0036B683B5
MTISFERLDRALASPPPALIPGQLAIPDGPRIGSVCTGYGGLDEAVMSVLGGSLAWVADPDDGPARILAHHHPDTPNLGDITAVDWTQAEPVDIYIGGYPCQPFSYAGRRKGTADARHLWPHIAASIRVLRPRLCLFENVANHLRIGFRDVLRDLAELRFDAEWCFVRASDIGAPHQRERLFLAAWPTAHPPHFRYERSGQARHGRPRSAHGDRPTADAGRPRLEVGRVEPDRHERATAQRSDRAPVQWGKYAAAVARWEATTGRPAPRPTDDRGRLNPPFVEWMMGLEAGHVTAVPGLSRNAQLHALGNGVVPPQAALAVRHLLDRATADHGQAAA